MDELYEQVLHTFKDALRAKEGALAAREVILDAREAEAQRLSEKAHTLSHEANCKLDEAQGMTKSLHCRLHEVEQRQTRLAETEEALRKEKARLDSDYVDLIVDTPLLQVLAFKYQAWKSRGPQTTHSGQQGDE
tara:strand:+ start:16070 stop:16471 length:402 start_codon:yes stop_codon:yes gene_type:complete